MVAIADFGIIVAVSTIAGVVALKLRQPYVIGLLLAGMIVGPHQLGLLAETELIKVFAEVGAILLLFAIGLEFSVNSLKGLAPKAVALAATKMGFIILVGYLAGNLFGLSPITSMFLAAILSITSTAIVIKIVSEKNYVNRKEIPLLVASLIIEDIIAVFMLAILTGITNNGELSVSFILSIAKALLLFGLFYLVISKVLKVFLDWLARDQVSETLAFTSLTIGVGLSFLAQVAGVPASIGAFLAGNLIASLKQGEDFKQAIYPLIFIFSALFFLSIGMTVDLSSILSNWALVIAIIIVALVAKFIAMGTAYYFVEGNSKSAAFSAVAMLSIGEFSLLLAELSKHVVTEINLVSLTAVLVLCTSIATTLLIDRYESLWRLTQQFMPQKFVNTGRGISNQNRQFFDFLEFNHTANRLLTKVFSLLHENILLIAIGAGAYLFTVKSTEAITVSGMTFTYALIGLAIAVIGAFLALANLIVKLNTEKNELPRFLEVVRVLKNLTKMITLPVFIWIGVVIVAIFTILNVSRGIIDSAILVGLLLLVVYMFTTGSQTRGKPIMWGK